MSTVLAIGIMIGVAVVILLAMLIGWRARVRRDAALTAPLGVPEHAQVITRHGVLYVATTKHDQPLERLALAPLAFRAKGEAAVTDRGLALCLDGAPTVFVATARLVDVDRATVAIDKVVEPGGLVRVTWNAADDTIVDSYIRIADGDSADFIAELRRLVPATHDTGATS